MEGRGGYFDRYGIVRDVMQNHLLQILALVAMEPPASLDGNAIRNEKVRALRAVAPVAAADLVVGQYTAAARDGRAWPGYTDDPTVARDSLTPTFAAAVLQVHTPRWEGVPFFISAGKGLDARLTEIRIHFRDVEHNLFCRDADCPAANELVIRVQPQEAIDFRIVNKVPGLEMKLAARELDLRYTSAFSGAIIPDAYESLLLEVLRGERGPFIRSDELEAAWDIVTPVLHELESSRVRPEPYEFLGRGPAAAHALAARLGMTLP